MNQKRYWWRGIIIGIVAYILFYAISSVFIFSGVVTCNALITNGPTVKDSILCGPILTWAGIPLMAVSELMEDISNGTLTHSGLYLGVIGSIIIYLGISALLGYWYGKSKKE